MGDVPAPRVSDAGNMIDSEVRGPSPRLLVDEVSGPDKPGFALPTGTVTFLLTDVEGSTRRWEDAPAAMAAAVPRHYEILDDAVAHHGGVRPVEQGEGDSVVAAFARASDAVAAAIDAQRMLLSEEWPSGCDLHVRMHPRWVRRQPRSQTVLQLMTRRRSPQDVVTWVTVQLAESGVPVRLHRAVIDRVMTFPRSLEQQGPTVRHRPGHPSGVAFRGAVWCPSAGIAPAAASR